MLTVAPEFHPVLPHRIPRLGLAPIFIEYVQSEAITEQGSKRFREGSCAHDAVKYTKTMHSLGNQGGHAAIVRMVHDFTIPLCPGFAHTGRLPIRYIGRGPGRLAYHRARVERGVVRKGCWKHWLLVSGKRRGSHPNRNRIRIAYDGSVTTPAMHGLALSNLRAGGTIVFFPLDTHIIKIGSTYDMKQYGVYCYTETKNASIDLVHVGNLNLEPDPHPRSAVPVDDTHQDMGDTDYMVELMEFMRLDALKSKCKIRSPIQMVSSVQDDIQGLIFASFSNGSGGTHYVLETKPCFSPRYRIYTYSSDPVDHLLERIWDGDMPFKDRSLYRDFCLRLQNLFIGQTLGPVVDLANRDTKWYSTKRVPSVYHQSQECIFEIDRYLHGYRPFRPVDQGPTFEMNLRQAEAKLENRRTPDFVDRALYDVECVY
jgi:hypothetical protein